MAYSGEGGVAQKGPALIDQTLGQGRSEYGCAQDV